MSLVRKTLKHNDSVGMLKAIDRIEVEKERLNDMIGQLLMLSRLEANQVFEFSRVDLNMLLQRLSVDATFEAESKRKRISFIEHDTAIIEGNRELLLRAIENVVRNAIHYASRHIQVSLTTAGGVIILCVEDDGPGVAEDELEQLFYPFYRLSAARDRHTGGVGLAIARQAVQSHVGKISAKNTPEGGLSVCIQLPFQVIKQLQ
jgi:two-component system sensor histidine kinase CpxA